MDNFIQDFVVFDDGGGPALYAGGDFITAGATTVNHIAKWNGTSWSAVGTGMNGIVYALAVFDDGGGEALFAGGAFTNAGGGAAENRIAKWNGSNWSALGPGLNALVYDLAVFDDGGGEALYAGGAFTNVEGGGTPLSKIAKWDGVSWSQPGSGLTGGSPFALTAYDDGGGNTLYAGGAFTSAGGVMDTSFIAKWNGSTWSAVGSGTSGIVEAFAAFDDGDGLGLYVGGAFADAGGTTVNHVAKWNGSIWSALGSGMNFAHVAALEVFNDASGPALYAAGSFTNAGGGAAENRIAKWNGSNWSALGIGMDATVQAVAIFGGALHVGGEFTTAGGDPSPYFARWSCPTIFVDDSAGGANDGTSWANAYTRLQDALAVATSGSQVWVAEGTYKPDQGGGETPGDRTATFQLLDGVALYGGFSGSETLLNHRNPAINVTILSGDLNGNDTSVPCIQDSPACDSFGGRCLDGFCVVKANDGENSHHVVTGSGTNSTAVLDGFTITAGNTSGAAVNSGGGLLVETGSPTIRNCGIVRNRAIGAGGVQVTASNSEISFCTISGNYSQSGTGGLANGAGNPTVRSCVFDGNTGNYIGAAGCNTSAGFYEDCVFTNNRAGLDGGAVGAGSCNITYRRCAFFGNRAGVVGGAIEIQNSTVKLHECQFGLNTATSQNGGAINSRSGANLIDIVNCTFAGNTADDLGGGLYHDSGTANVVNSTFFGNVATTGNGGGGAFAGGGTLNITNCIMFGNASAAVTTEADQLAQSAATLSLNYSNVQGLSGGLGGTGNVGGDPFFVDSDGPDNVVGTSDDDLRVRPDSPAIDAAHTPALPMDTNDADGDGNTTERYPFDLAGKPRNLDDPATADTGVPGSAVVDMGAYEFFTDCNGNGLADVCDLSCGAPDGPCDLPGCGMDTDCNGDMIHDACGVPVDCDHTEVQKLLPLDGHPEQRFGWGVGIWQDSAVIGGVFDDDLGTDAGALYVFEFNGTQWNQSAKLLASDGSADDWLGNAAAIDGNRIVGGAPLQRAGGGSGPGAVYVFEFTSGSWVQTAKLTASDANNQDFFGGAVAMSGNRIIVGAKDDDDLGNASGAAYIFERNGSQWTQTAKLTASDGEPLDGFGLSVAISGDVAIVGAPFQMEPNSEFGAAYVFRFNGTNWVEQAILSANDAAANDKFGQSVALSGNRAVVAAQYGDGAASNTGSLYVFEYNFTWQQTAELFAADGTLNDAFGGGGGAPLALSGNRILVGASTDEPMGGEFSVGSAYLFQFDGVSWSEVAKLTGTGTGESDIFGLTVALDGDRGMVAAPWKDDLGAKSGAVYFFDFNLPDCNCNGVANVCDLSLGSSFDCNANGVPDDCEIADCAGDPDCGDCDSDGVLNVCEITNCPGASACDDCNLNGVQDACDISSMTSEDVSPADGIPDECFAADSGCDPTRDWSCTKNWPPLPGGAPYPDNNVNSTFSVTLPGGTDFFLDVDVAIDTLRVVDTAVLNVTQSGSAGDLMIVDPGGMLLDHGTINVGDDRTITVSPGPVLITEGSRYQADPGRGIISATLSSADVTITEGDLTTGGPGTMMLSQSMQLITSGHFRLNGIGAFGSDEKGNCRPPVAGWLNAAAVTVGGDLRLDHSVDLTVTTTEPVIIGGNLDNRSLFPAGFVADTATFEFGIDLGTTHTLEVAGRNLGFDGAGFLINFAIDTIRVADGHSLVFTNQFANQSGAGSCQEAQYVRVLDVGDNATVFLSNAVVYYETLILGSGATIVPGICGSTNQLVACDASLCADGNVCTNDVCNSGFCEHIPLGMLTYGDTSLDGLVDLTEVLCILNAYQSLYSYACPLERADLAPCGNPDTLIELGDVLAVLGAYAGTATCPDPCPGGASFSAPRRKVLREPAPRIRSLGRG